MNATEHCKITDIFNTYLFFPYFIFLIFQEFNVIPGKTKGKILYMSSTAHFSFFDIITNAVIVHALKGVCHEIFDLQFFS